MHSLYRTAVLTILLLAGILLVGDLLTSDTHADDWPMYRKNSQRTATCQFEMPSELALQWTRQLAPLTPAFHSPRLQFDAGHEPVAADGMLLIASSETDSVTAYDAATGEHRWAFRTNGPVRCAPAIWRDRVCFGSDDGFFYCVELKSGKLCWKHQAVPSDRRLLGNRRLISVWPIRGGPVVADGNVYFAAGVWPFEGVFVYSMDIESGRVNWRNDRLGYLFGQHPHNTEAIGGLAPQGYLLINHDELIVPCSTAFPARLNRNDGSLIDFELPGPGRLPGGWFSQVDLDTARALRRGAITFDNVVNRQQHEGKEQKAPGGVSGLSRQIHLGDTELNLDDPFPGVDGTIHSVIVAEGRIFVVTRSGMLSCFAKRGSKESNPKHWIPSVDPVTCVESNLRTVRTLTAYMTSNRGIAVVLGLQNGDLVHALVQNSNFQVIAFDDNPKLVERLRESLEATATPASRAAVIECDLSSLELPPYLATLVVSERDELVVKPPLQSLHPYGGVMALEINVNEKDTNQFTEEMIKGQRIIRRVGTIPGSKQYSGDWASCEDEQVRFPLGVLWFDDSLAHFKRSPQPRFIDDVMISQPKNWHVDRFTEHNKIDYPLLPAVLSDIYTGRVLQTDEKAELRSSLPQKVDPTKLEPSQYRPPRQTNPANSKQPVVGQRINPLTGQTEPRSFPKTYGCDGGVDYGLLYTLRSGAPAYYDKTLESGTVFLSGPRSGCTNSIIPSGGLLNVPYFYEGCTCSYPLPSALSLVPMPQRFEQWASWGEMDIKPNSIQRIGVNFGAPGDRMTRQGTLWLDHPSVGGPSPRVAIEQKPKQVHYRYQHSLWMNRNDEMPWVNASMAEGLESVTVNDLQPGEYSVRLFFAEPEHTISGQRIQQVQLQGKVVNDHLDIVDQAGETMKGIVLQYEDIQIDSVMTLRLTPLQGRTLISGIELVRQNGRGQQTADDK